MYMSSEEIGFDPQIIKGYAVIIAGFQAGPTFPIFPTFPYFFDLLLLFPTFS